MQIDTCTSGGAADLASLQVVPDVSGIFLLLSFDALNAYDCDF
jgi:hypothetical protein